MKRYHIWSIGVAIATFSSIAVADPLTDAVKAKTAAAKAATDKAAAANEVVRETIVKRADAARADSDASRELAAVKKVLAPLAVAAKGATDKNNAAVAALKAAEAAKAAAGKACADCVAKAAAARKAVVANKPETETAAKAAEAKAEAEKKNIAAKDAAVKAAAKTVADAKAAAAKPEADKAAQEKIVKDIEAKIAGIKKTRAALEVTYKDVREKYKFDRRASYPFVAAKAAAEKALAEKTAANATAAVTDTAKKASAAKTVVAQAKAAKAAADKACADCTNKAAAAKKAVAGKKDAAKVAADKAAKDADTKVAAAKKAIADKTATVQNAEKAFAAATAAAKKAADNRTAANKNLSAKTSADKVADETVKGSNLYIAIRAKDDAVKEKAAAVKALTTATNAESKANSIYAAAKSASDKANATKVAAEKALAVSNVNCAASKKTSDAKVAAEKAAAGKPTLNKAKAETAAAAKALAAAGANCAASKKNCDAKIAAAKQAAGKAGAAKAALDKVVAATSAARNAVAEKTKAIPPLQDKEAVERIVVQGGLKSMGSTGWTYAKARHLMVRAGFGGTPAEVQKLYEMGLHDAVDHFVEIYRQPAPDIGFDPARAERSRSWQSRLPWDERQYMTVKFRNPERVQQAQMRRWWLKRMAESPRPLQEKMSLFWHDHFAVQYQKRYLTYMLFKQNQLFRTYGTDNYAAMLRGIVHDPAMLSYLDNNVNIVKRGNENLGREILELFSLGEGGGYSEDDLREASRALTGYNFDSATQQFRTYSSHHDNENKKVLGSNGNWNGDELVDIIIRQPSTAKYISGKIFKFLAHEDPSSVTSETMAELMRYASYDLKPVLKNLFLSEEFYSEKAMGSHIKGPVELTVGAIRDLAIKDVNYGTIDAAINQMGQVLFEPPNVAGWNEGRTWINAERILVRYNQMARILEAPNVDLVELLKNDAVDTPEKVVDQLVKACLVVSLDPEKRKALADYLGTLPPKAEWEAKKNEINAKLRAVLVLLMSTPGSQLG